MTWEKIAERLWDLLDSIDTASDCYKPRTDRPRSVEEYVRAVRHFHKQRFDYLIGCPHCEGLGKDDCTKCQGLGLVAGHMLRNMESTDIERPEEHANA